MNICLVSQEYPPDTVRGGVGVQTWNKARALAGLDHGVHVLSCAGRTGPGVFEGGAGITIHRIEAPDADCTIHSTEAYWLGYSWKVLKALEDLRKDTSFDVIDFAEYGAEGFAFQSNRCRWNWTPVVVQLHAPLAMFTDHIGWPDKDSDFHRIGTFMEGYSIRRADGLMACSANIADYTAERYGIARDEIDVVHCGVDADSFRADRDAVRAGAAPRVLFVGNVALNKGVRTTVEAVLRIRESFPDIRLQILGKGDDDLVNELRARVRAENAGGNVEFCGFVPREELPRFYRDADVFCSPASYEGGVANVYLEAMASECPVIASTSGAASEAVSDGGTGFVVPPGDVDSVAVALRKLLADPALRRKMGRLARERVERYFAMDKYIDRVCGVYRKAIVRSSRRLSKLNDGEA